MELTPPSPQKNYAGLFPAVALYWLHKSNSVKKSVAVAILLEHELACLRREFEQIKSRVHTEDRAVLKSRLDAILVRLRASRQARIDRAGLKLVK